MPALPGRLRPWQAHRTGMSLVRNQDRPCANGRCALASSANAEVRLRSSRSLAVPCRWRIIRLLLPRGIAFGSDRRAAPSPAHEIREPILEGGSGQQKCCVERKENAGGLPPGGWRVFASRCHLAPPSGQGPPPVPDVGLRFANATYPTSDRPGRDSPAIQLHIMDGRTERHQASESRALRHRRAHACNRSRGSPAVNSRDRCRSR